MVKKLKQQYETPNEGWSEERIRKEDELIDEYGLKNKKEIYKAESELRSLRRQARKLIAKQDDEQKEALINKVHELGLLPGNANLEDILTLNVTDILDRRLQTAVDRRGHSETPKHARQLVTHGHVYINGKKINIPGYLLTQEEEKQLEVNVPEPEETGQEDEEQEEETSESKEEKEEENNEEGEEQ